MTTTRQPDAIDHAIADAIEHLRDTVGPLVHKAAVEAVARDLLRDRDGKLPAREELDEIVQNYLRGFSVVQPEKALEFGPGCRIECNGKTYEFDAMLAELPAERQKEIRDFFAKRDETIDAGARLVAQQRHLQNIDRRLKKIERGEP